MPENRINLTKYERARNLEKLIDFIFDYLQTEGHRDMDNFLHYQVEVWKVLVAFGAFYLSFKYFNNASPKSVAKTVAEKSG